MKTSAKEAAAARGRKIMAAAKLIRKAHPGKKWTACVAEAGKKARG